MSSTVKNCGFVPIGTVVIEPLTADVGQKGEVGGGGMSVESRGERARPPYSRIRGGKSPKNIVAQPRVLHFHFIFGSLRKYLLVQCIADSFSETTLLPFPTPLLAWLSPVRVPCPPAKKAP